MREREEDHEAGEMRGEDIPLEIEKRKDLPTPTKEKMTREETIQETPHLDPDPVEDIKPTPERESQAIDLPRRKTTASPDTRIEKIEGKERKDRALRSEMADPNPETSDPRTEAPVKTGKRAAGTRVITLHHLPEREEEPERRTDTLEEDPDPDPRNQAREADPETAPATGSPSPTG